MVLQLPVYAVAMFGAMSGEWLIFAVAVALWFPIWRFDSLRLVERPETGGVPDSV